MGDPERLDGMSISSMSRRPNGVSSNSRGESGISKSEDSRGVKWDGLECRGPVGEEDGAVCDGMLSIYWTVRSCLQIKRKDIPRNVLWLLLRNVAEWMAAWTRSFNSTNTDLME
jgi:hypothetical protein